MVRRTLATLFFDGRANVATPRLLAGYLLAAQGTQIHVAAGPGRELASPPSIGVWSRQLLLSRAFASQAACYVIAAGGVRRLSDTPERYRELVARSDNTGDSYIIDPRGEVIAGPAEGETILVANGSLEEVLAAKAGCDIAVTISGKTS